MCNPFSTIVGSACTFLDVTAGDPRDASRAASTRVHHGVNTRHSDDAGEALGSITGHYSLIGAWLGSCITNHHGPTAVTRGTTRVTRLRNPRDFRVVCADRADGVVLKLSYGAAVRIPVTGAAPSSRHSSWRNSPATAGQRW